MSAQEEGEEKVEVLGGLHYIKEDLDGSCIIAKGRSKKDDIPTTSHLCHLDIEEEEVDSLVDCRNCRKLAHRDCEEATVEDCGTF